MQCVTCILNKFLGNWPEGATGEQKLQYARALSKIISDSDNTVSAPEIVALATAKKAEIFGVFDDFANEKSHFNQLMMSVEGAVEDGILSAEDPLKKAMRFALLGNYIDFGAMDSVDETRLLEMFKNVDRLSLDEEEYSNFCTELGAAKRLVYLTDNCGEVVMDKLLIKQLKRVNPGLSVTVLVRGESVLNDATMQDACQIGLTNVAIVIPNGTGIAGTCIEKLSDEARNAVLTADIIISKGQGNFETLHDCGLNIYYLFLCKCKLFSDRFNVKPLTEMFLNDKRMK